MTPGTVTGALGMTTEEKETGTEGGVGTAMISGPEIANMTDDILPRPIVLHRYHPVVTITMNLILLLAEPHQRIHLGEGARPLPEV